MVEKVIGVIVIVIILGALIPVLWPMFVATDTAIQAITEGGTITDFLQVMWPIGLIVISIGIAVGLIYLALREFGLIHRGKK